MNRSSPETGGQSITFLGEFSRKLAINTLFNVFGRLWSFLVTLLLTPYILSHLSVQEFGLWVLLSVFISSFTLLDLGLGSSFVKFISTYYTHEDYESINKVVFSGLSFYALFGFVLLGAGLAIESPLFNFFGIQDASRPYLLILIASAIQNIGSMFLSVFKGIQRMDKSNSIEIQMSLVNVVGTVFFLHYGFGLQGLALNALITSIIATFVAWFAARRTVPRFALRFHFDSKLLREMFGYGLKIQVSQLASRICFQFDKLIIPRFLGIGAISFYEVSSRLTLFMRAGPLVMISAIIPATSELEARNDRARILKAYSIASKYVAMLTVALVAFIVLEAESLLGLWLGKGFEQSVVLVQILAIGYGFNVLGGAASQTGAGVGRPEFDMRSTVLLTVLNPILSLVFIRQFGAAGAAMGTSLALMCATLYLLITFHRNYLESSPLTIIREIYIRPIAAGVFADLAVSSFHHVVPMVMSWNTSRFLIPLKLTADFALFSCFYMALLVALRQLTAIDWNNFTGFVSFGFEFLRHPFRDRVKIYR